MKSNSIEIREGQAYIRYEGVTYKIDLQYFKLVAIPGIKTIEIKGIVEG